MLDTNSFGRWMMLASGNLNDDTLCNAFARVGDTLTKLGQPRSPKRIADLSKEDQQVLATALYMLANKVK